MTRTARAMTDRLQALIARNGGYFSRAEALSHGHHDQDLQTWLRTGLIVQATRGVYYLAPEAEEGWADLSAPAQDERHELLRTLAVLHALPATVVASHGSALLVHRLPRKQHAQRRATIHVMPVGAPAISRRARVRMHAPISGTVRDPGCRAVSIEDAIVQAGCADGLVAAAIPADAAMHEGRLDLARLRAACKRAAGQRGATGIGDVLDLVDGRSESPGETWTRIICHDHAISVTPQVEISDERGQFARVDLLIDGTRVALEFDGLSKYANRDTLRKEKIREQRLHRAGYVVVRITWRDFADIPALVARIRAAISRAA